MSLLYSVNLPEIVYNNEVKGYDKDICEDLTSETFFKALNKINSFKNLFHGDFVLI